MPSTASVATSCCSALLATPGRLFRPRRRDERLLASLGDAGVPSASVSVRLTALPQARQAAPAAVVAEGARRPWRVELGMTSFLVEHPRARFLVDPAMCDDVHTRVLPEVPGPLRAVVAPDRPVVGMGEALERAGQRPEGVDFALPTHLHWDHIAGLADLPDVAVRTAAAEQQFALAGSDTPLCCARGPVAGREVRSYELDGPAVLTFPRSHDLFGDGAVVLLDLAGHTPGSVGILLAVDGGRRVLLAGDAIWHGLQTRLLREKAPFPGMLVDNDREAAFATLHRLYALPSAVDVIAAHDLGAASAWAPPNVV